MLRRPQTHTSFLLTHMVFLATLAVGGALTGLQANMITLQQARRTVTQVQPSAKAEIVEKTDHEIADMMNFMWAMGGSLGGAYIGLSVGLTPFTASNDGKNWPKVARGFAVSLITGTVATPYVTHSCMVHPVHWSASFALGGGISAGAWLLWSGVNAILQRLVVRAQRGGIGGVIEELTNRHDVSSTQAMQTQQTMQTMPPPQITRE